MPEEEGYIDEEMITPVKERMKRERECRGQDALLY